MGSHVKMDLGVPVRDRKEAYKKPFISQPGNVRPVMGLSRGCCTALLLMVAAVALLSTSDSGTGAGTTYIDGDWFWSYEDVTLSDGTWWVNGSVRFSHCDLVLDNATLVIDDGDRSFLASYESSTITVRNSTIRGTDHGVSISVYERGEFYDSVLYSEDQEEWDSQVEAYWGDVTLVNCSIGKGRTLVSCWSNLTVRGCWLGSFTYSAIRCGYSRYVDNEAHVLIEDCTIENPLHDRSGTGVMASGPEYSSTPTTLTIRRNVIRNLARAIWVSDAMDNGTVLVEGNTGENCFYGVDLGDVGRAVTLRHNTWWTVKDGGYTAITIYVRASSAPTIENETIYGMRTGVRVQEGWGNVLRFWHMNVTGVNDGFVLVGAKVDIHSSFVRAHRTEFHAGSGRIRLFDCDHTYVGLVSEGGEIIELNRFDITKVTWQDGCIVPPGRVDLVGFDERSQADLRAPGPAVVNVTSWHLSESGYFKYPVVWARYRLQGVEFNSEGIPSSPSRTMTLVIVDDSVPEVSFIIPRPGSVVTGDPLYIMGDYEEVGTGVEEVNIRMDDGSWFPSRELDGGLWSISIPVLEDGDHLVAVQVIDRGGNVGRAFLEVTTDSTAPLIEMDGPGRLTRETVVDIAILTEENATVLVNCVEVPPVGPGIYDVTVELVEGDNWVGVVVTDLAGNVATRSYRIELDTTPPTVELLAPADGSWTSSNTLLVEVGTEEGAMVRVNGLAAVGREGRFSVTVPTYEGRFDFTVTARDSAGNVVNVSYVVFVDADAPVINVGEPENGTMTDQDSILVTGRVTDWGPVNLTLNGLRIDMTGTSYLAWAGLREGDNSLTLRVTDPAGNEATRTVLVIRDTTPPVVDVVLRIGDEEHASSETWAITSELRVDLLVNSSEDAVLYVSGYKARNVKAGTIIFPVDLRANRRNEVLIDAQDAMGNAIKTISINVTTDTLDPTIRIHTPMQGERTESTTVRVDGYTEPGARLTLNDQEVQVEEDGSFDTTVELEIGMNILELVAVDDAGNVATETRSVERVIKGTDQGPGRWLLFSVVVIVMLMAFASVLWRGSRMSKD